MLTPDPLKREAPQMFKPTQIRTTITPNTFTAQDVGINSNADLDQFWNRVLMQNTQIQLSNYLENHKVMISIQYIMNNIPTQDQILIIT